MINVELASSHGKNYDYLQPRKEDLEMFFLNFFSNLRFLTIEIYSIGFDKIYIVLNSG